MAERLRKTHQDDVRKKIQASQIINRLQNHIYGKVELTASQVAAARILLDKSVSNAPTDLNANVDGKLTVEIVRYGTDQPSA